MIFTDFGRTTIKELAPAIRFKA